MLWAPFLPSITVFKYEGSPSWAQVGDIVIDRPIFSADLQVQPATSQLWLALYVNGSTPAFSSFVTLRYFVKPDGFPFTAQ